MRVPPFRQYKPLYKIYLDKVDRDKKLEDAAKKKAQQDQQNQNNNAFQVEEEKKGEDDSAKYDCIANYEFPLYEPGAGKEAENIYEYNEKDITLYEICESYGTPYKPPLDPKDDIKLLPE